MRIDDLNIDAAVIPVGIVNGGLDVPENPGTLGWWSGSVKPGARAGSVVIDGHVDSAQLGLGAFFHLSTLRIGAVVKVTTTAHTLDYTVVGRRVYHKQTLPSEVFTRGGTPRLVLITCGGPFDSSTLQYLDNVVVYAVPAT